MMLFLKIRRYSIADHSWMIGGSFKEIQLSLNLFDCSDTVFVE